MTEGRPVDPTMVSTEDLIVSENSEVNKDFTLSGQKKRKDL